MKITRSLAFHRSLLFGVLGIVALTTFARGQEPSGRFTLPYAARCGTAVLPAGEYRYSIDLSSSTPITTLPKSAPNPAGFMLMAASTSEVSSNEPGRLVVERVAGERVVTDMYVHDLSLAIRYAAPKTRISQVASQNFDQAVLSATQTSVRHGR